MPLLDFESERRVVDDHHHDALPLRIRGVIGPDAQANKERATYATNMWYNPVQWISAGHYAATERSNAYNSGNARRAAENRAKQRTYYHGCKVDVGKKTVMSIKFKVRGRRSKVLSSSILHR